MINYGSYFRLLLKYYWFTFVGFPSACRHEGGLTRCARLPSFVAPGLLVKGMGTYSLFSE